MKELLIILIPILLKYHKEIFSLVRIITQILIELKNEILLYRKRQQEIHEAMVLKLEYKRRNDCYEYANRESLRRIREYIEKRKKEMAEDKSEIFIEEKEKKIAEEFFSKIKNNKKLSVAIATLLLVLLSTIPQLAHYKFTVFYCEDKIDEATCELVSEDLSEGLSNLIGAFVE